MSVDALVARKTPPAETDWPVEYEDFRRLFWKYKGILKEQERNTAFWNATNDNLQSAYQRLDEQDQELERAYGLNREYLDNIQEGLLLVDRDHRILDQYSAYLCELFRRQDIAGMPLIDLVYPAQTDQQQDREELSRFLSALFSNAGANQSMLEELNPLARTSLVTIAEDGQRNTVEIAARFTRIVEDDTVSHIIFIVEDRTEITQIQNELEQERNRRSSEVESISAILRAGPETFAGFIEESRGVVAELEARRTRLDDTEMLADTLRKLHSLKGSAKYLELDQLAGLAHEMEEDLLPFKDGSVSVGNETIQAITGGLTRLNDQLTDATQLADRIHEFSRMDRENAELRTDSVRGFLASIKRMVLRMAGELEKTVEVTTFSDVEELPALAELRASMIHIVRNAVDHGIETELERVSAGKKAEGRIILRIRGDGTGYLLEVIDDGRGIDYARVEERARALGLVAPDETVSVQRLTNLLFTPSFSSKETATELSGRGVGLDVVRDAVLRMGGQITVGTKGGRGTRVRIRVPAKEIE